MPKDLNVFIKKTAISNPTTAAYIRGLESKIDKLEKAVEKLNKKK